MLKRYLLSNPTVGLKGVLGINRIPQGKCDTKNGSVSETVQVDTTPTPLDTSSATLGEVVPASSIEGLPLNVRDPFALVGLTPGVQFGGNFGNGGGYRRGPQILS